MLRHEPTEFLGQLQVIGYYWITGEGLGKGSGRRLYLFVAAKAYDHIFIFSAIPSSKSWGFASSLWGLPKENVTILTTCHLDKRRGSLSIRKILVTREKQTAKIKIVKTHHFLVILPGFFWNIIYDLEAIHTYFICRIGKQYNSILLHTSSKLWIQSPCWQI